MKFDEIFRAFKSLKISFLLEPFLDIIDDFQKITSTHDIIRSAIHLTVTSSFLIFGGLFPHLVYPPAGSFVTKIFTDQFQLPNWLGDYLISTLAFMWAFATPASFVTKGVLKGTTNCIYGDSDYYLTRNRAIKAAKGMHQQFQNSDNLKDVSFDDVLGFVVSLHDWIVDKLALKSDDKDLSSELLIPARESLLRGDLNPKLVKVIKYMLNEHNVANDAMDALYRKYYLKDSNITELNNITVQGSNLSTCGTITALSNNSTNTNTPVEGRFSDAINKRSESVEHSLENNKILAEILKKNLKEVGQNQLKLSVNMQQELSKSIKNIQDEIANLFNQDKSNLNYDEINAKVLELTNKEQDRLITYLKQTEESNSEFNDCVINMEELIKQQEQELQKEIEVQKEIDIQKEIELKRNTSNLERIATTTQFNNKNNQEAIVDIGNHKNKVNIDTKDKVMSKDSINQVSFFDGFRSCKGWADVKKRI